jgi:hypothetical protein
MTTQEWGFGGAFIVEMETHANLLFGNPPINELTKKYTSIRIALNMRDI